MIDRPDSLTLAHGGGGCAAAPRRPVGQSAAPSSEGPTLGMVAINGWHAHPPCVGERFCRCGLCHLATECAEPESCVVLETGSRDHGDGTFAHVGSAWDLPLGSGVRSVSPMFSRRHYNRIARAIRDARPIGPRPAGIGKTEYDAALNAVVLNLAEMFTKDNPRFDFVRFCDAAELPDPGRANGRMRRRRERSA